MKISIISVGKLKEKYLKQGIQEYIKRLGPYATVDIQEVPDEKAPENSYSFKNRTRHVCHHTRN